MLIIEKQLKRTEKLLIEKYGINLNDVDVNSVRSYIAQGITPHEIAGLLGEKYDLIEHDVSLYSTN
jgi:hypothetical protein